MRFANTKVIRKNANIYSFKVKNHTITGSGYPRLGIVCFFLQIAIIQTHALLEYAPLIP